MTQHHKRSNVRGGAQDLVLLSEINEENVVLNLGNRFKNDLIYTYIGEVLVSLNPYKNIPGLYSKELMEEYMGRNHFEVAPHLFATAEHAFRQLMNHKRNQCVIISGESGAGKTEAAKKILQYITVVSENRDQNYSKLSIGEVKEALLKSNPVVEAFGNAKTLRNHNSSRFGKYLVINFDYGGAPTGGFMQSYMLEKPRVVAQAPGERNFHIFYQLCEGRASYPELGLGKAEEYPYTSGMVKIKGKNDLQEFKTLEDAMSHVGISVTDKKSIFKLLAAILHISKVEFESNSKDGFQVVGKSKQALEKAAKLLGLSTGDLERSLTNRTIKSKNMDVSTPLRSVDECLMVRDALAKAVYSRNFLKLFDLMNKRIESSLRELSIGLLDIYGFEIFELNSFEQLCINYCNEKLQQLFIELTLKKEQEEYEREGINWVKVDYFNNKIVCDLIEEKRPPGVMAFLNEECLVPGGSDESFVRKLGKNLSKHPQFISMYNEREQHTREFTIKHYAGNVTYNAGNILEKNRDLLFPNIKWLIKGSTETFFSELFPEAHDGKNPRSVSTSLMSDMKDLVGDLNKCEPHYVRTIKSNSQERGNLFDDKLVQHQVQYLGIVENVRVRRAGYAFRCGFSYFMQHFKILSRKTWPQGSGDLTADTKIILNEIGITKFKMGHTKVFIEDPEDVFKLEDARAQKMHYIASVIQKAYRDHRSWLHFLELRYQSAKLLHGLKRRCNSWALYCFGDYQNASKNPTVKRAIGNRRVEFADTVKEYKLLPKKIKSSSLLFVITQEGIYLFRGSKLETSVPFSAMRFFGLSTFADGFFIFRFEGKKKMLTSIILESSRKAEICAIVEACNRASGWKDFCISFVDSMDVEVEKKAMFGRKKIIDAKLSFTESDQMVGRSTNLCQDPVGKDSGSKFLFVVQVANKLGSLAPYQRNSPFPERLEHFKSQKLRSHGI